MSPDDVTAILRTRRELTGESFNDGTVAAWRDALAAWTPTEIRNALITASREHQRVTVANVTEHLPRHARATEIPPVQCELCDGSGWAAAPPARAHNPSTCHPDPEHPCLCHAVEACRCTTGRQRTDTARHIVEHNRRATPAWMRDTEPAPLEHGVDAYTERLQF